ncbi:DUF397 domain-containing protein [Actinoallomurus sp. CA-150999]
MTGSAPSGETWRKSTFSGSNESDCVEVAVVSRR